MPDPKTIALRLDEDLLKKIKDDAKKYRTTTSDVIRKLLLYNYGFIDQPIYGIYREAKK